MPLEIVPFTSEHLAPAAELLAARHRADRQRAPVLPPAFGDPAVALPALEELVAAPAADGWAALERGRVAGYLVGKCLLLAETSLEAAFLDSRAVLVPFAGYAAIPDDVEAVYRALYAVAAERWVAGGYFAHSIRTTADPFGVEPWFSLGFGRRITNGMRALDADAGMVAPPDLPPPLLARRAGPADLDAVHGIVADLARYHAGAPIFMPYLAEAVAAERDEIEGWLADPVVAYWLAESEGEAVGLMGLHPAEGFVDDGRRLERCAYLFLGHMTASARGHGVGSVLVEHGLAWARRENYAACVVDWFAANPLSSHFWPRRGFAPFASRLERRVDPRLGWAGLR